MLLVVAVRPRRCPVTTEVGSPRNKERRYPPDPPSVEEIVAVMRGAGDRSAGFRLRALIVILSRAGLRISEALSLAETDLDSVRGAILVRRGKGGQAPRGRNGQMGMGTTQAVA